MGNEENVRLCFKCSRHKGGAQREPLESHSQSDKSEEGSLVRRGGNKKSPNAIRR